MNPLYCRPVRGTNRGQLLGLAIVLTTLLPSCGGDGVGLDDGPLTLEVDGFSLVTKGPITAAQAQTLLDALLENSGRIREHLQVTEMPEILVRVWHSTQAEDWYATMSSSLGTVYPGATGYVWGPGEMRLFLNPQSGTEVIHEYAHLVSMQVNPSIPNNPRWLWEAVAMYEAGQGENPALWRESDRQFPGFEALNAFNSPLPYRWGFLVSEAIIRRWGDDAYVEMIRQNGRSMEVLGVTEAQLGLVVEEHLDTYL